MMEVVRESCCTVWRESDYSDGSPWLLSREEKLVDMMDFESFPSGDEDFSPICCNSLKETAYFHSMKNFILLTI